MYFILLSKYKYIFIELNAKFVYDWVVYLFMGVTNQAHKFIANKNTPDQGHHSYNN